MNNPGFDLLREAFKKFAENHGSEDLTGRLVRSLAAGGKAAVEKATQEFPKTFIKEVVGDFYSTLSSQDVADGISMSVMNFDEEKIKEVLDSAVETLKTEETSLKVAKSLKDTLQKASTDDIENQIDGLMSGRSPAERMIFKAFFSQARPVIDEMRDAPVEEIAEKLRELADTIPTDAIASQVGALTREVTPERVSKQAHDFVGKLPSPAAVTDMVHGISTIAADKFGRVANGGSLNDARNALAEFAIESKQLVDATLSNDNAAKKTFKGGRKDFDL